MTDLHDRIWSERDRLKRDDEKNLDDSYLDQRNQEAHEQLVALYQNIELARSRQESDNARFVIAYAAAMALIVLGLIFGFAIGGGTGLAVGIGWVATGLVFGFVALRNAGRRQP